MPLPFFPGSNSHVNSIIPVRVTPEPGDRRPSGAARSLAAAVLVGLVLAVPCAGEEVEGEEREIHLWPLIESVRLPSGAKRTSVLGLFHHTVLPSGETYSFHILNYLQGPDYKVFFPFAYSIGEPGERHVGWLPFFFHGPTYWTAPLLLTGWWLHASGAETQWITPLFHRTLDVDGKLRHLHFLTYFQGPDYKVLFPFGYKAGPPGREHRGIVPLAFWGPGYASVPLLLSGRWTGEDGSDTLWITPLFHRTRDAEGALRHRHFLNYFEGANYKFLFPLAYRVDRPAGRHVGIIPFYFSGPDYKVILPFGYSKGPPGRKHRAVLPFVYWGPGYVSVPLLLSGMWTQPDGSGALWITPLFHVTREADGTVRSLHLLNYFQGPNYKILFPLAYRLGEPGHEHRGVVPFYFQGPRYKLAPLLLSGQWEHADGSNSLWITPLFHRTRDAKGNLKHRHVLNYFEGKSYNVLFPLLYSVDKPEGRHVGLVPFYFRGPDYKVLFPFAYRFGPEGKRHAGILPFYFRTPNVKLVPPLLTGWWRHADGSTTTWITPLFHKTRGADGKIRSLHLLNYFQGPNYKLLFPLIYSVGEPGKRHGGFIPFYFRGPDYKFSPPLLSGWWRKSDGHEDTWITPLFHKTRDKAGRLTSFHALNYFQGTDYKVLFPFAYSSGPKGRKHRGIVPLAFWGPDYFVAPPLLSGRWREANGSRTTLITPLFHSTRDETGRLTSLHFLNYFQGLTYKIFFPLAYSVGLPERRHKGIIPLAFWGPGYFVAPLLAPFYLRIPNAQLWPLLLSGRWRNPNSGATTTMITPLFHQTRNADGSLRHRHLLNYFEGPKSRTLFPFYWRWKDWTGDERTLIPLLFSRRKTSAGEVRASVLPPLFAYHRGARLDTSLGHQLRPFGYQRAGDDFEFNFLWRVFHIRRENRATRVVAAPFWWSQRPRPGQPLQFQVLGGLFARDCNYRRGSYRYRLLWFIPIGKRRYFQTATVKPREPARSPPVASLWKTRPPAATPIRSANSVTAWWPNSNR